MLATNLEWLQWEIAASGGRTDRIEGDGLWPSVSPRILMTAEYNPIQVVEKTLRLIGERAAPGQQRVCRNAIQVTLF